MRDSDLINDAGIVSQICEQCQLSPQAIQDVYPCTPLQSGMMVDSSLYVHVIVHRVDSSIDLSRLCAALDQVVALNSVLRTRIVDCDGAGLLQVVAREGQLVLQPAETNLQRFLAWNESVHIDLGKPLLRFAIVSAEDGTRLVTTMHHAIFDFHVLEFLMADTWSSYQGIPAQVRTPFKRFVEHCTRIDQKEAAAFWKRRFRSDASTFPPIPASHQVLANEIMTREIAFSEDEKLSTTLPSIALMPAYIEAAWAMTASDYTGNNSVIFGYTLSGRGPGLAGATETTFGPTVTTVPVQVDLRRNMTIQQLVKGRAASRRELSASRFLQFGLGRIRNINSDTRHASHFQSAVNIVHQSHTAGLDTPGLHLDQAHTEEAPKPQGLVLVCTPGDKQVSVKALFDPVVLPREQIHRILRQLEHRLRQLVISAPSTPLKTLPCLNFGDTLELMDWNARHFPSEPLDVCLHSHVMARAAVQPNEMAVRSWDGEATYAELVTMVNNAACGISAQLGDISVDEPICVMLGRSLPLVVALLAVMRVGGTCVPIDPGLPGARKEAIIRRCQARLVLVSPGSSPNIYSSDCMIHPVILNRSLDAARIAELPADMYPASRAAYVLFTSGSTGQPKGVVLEHRSLACCFTAVAEVSGWTRGSRVLQYSTPAWDACALEIIGSLFAGACVCIPSDTDRESGLGAYMKDAGVEYAVLTPTTLRNLQPEDVLPALKMLVSVGEPIPRKVFEKWSRKVRLYNAWGPCEASVVAATGHLLPDARHPDTIGRPMGCALWIVDPEDVNRLLPIGAMGEMLIDGPGVARGYYLAAEQTKASFIRPPSFVPRRQPGLASPHLYRSGDMARYNADGTISFSGRRDNQVKIRGQRFELGEVESNLASHQGVSEVMVTLYQTDTGSVNKDLVAVLTLYDAHKHHDAAMTKSNLDRIPLDVECRDRLQIIQEFAKEHLPSYMVPNIWLVVSGLPQTPSRKVDRVLVKSWLDTVDLFDARMTTQRGPLATPSPADGDRTLTPPADPAEVTLQHAWASVLHVDPSIIGRESSFLRLGGDSITAMQVATRCRKRGFLIAVADLLRKGTLAESAKEVQTARETFQGGELTMSVAEESQQRLLSPIQEFLVRNGGPAMHNQFNQAFLLDLDANISTAAAPDRIHKALRKLVEHHPMLRCRFSPIRDESGNNTLTQWIAPWRPQDEGGSMWRFRVHQNIDMGIDLRYIVSSSQASLDIFQGPVFSADVIVSCQGKTSLFLVAHHLVIDLVSWRILWEDLEAALLDDTCVLPTSLPFPLWLHRQHAMLESTSKSRSLSSPLWPKTDHSFWEMDGMTPKTKDSLQVQHVLDQHQTSQIMGPSCNSPFNTTPVILLLAAVILSFHRVFPDRGAPALYCEGHGRDTDVSDESLDTSRTIGWFTTVFPLAMHDIGAESRIEDVVVAVKDTYQNASKAVVEQFALQVYGDRTSSSLKRGDIELVVNFAGRMQQVTRKDALLKLRTDGPPVHLENVTGDSEPVGLLSLFAFIGEDERLTLTLDYNRHMAHQDRIIRWMQEDLGSCFKEMASTLRGRPCRLTSSDLPLLNLGSAGPRSLEYLHSHLEELGVAQDNIESIYPCTATQEGILFAQLNGHDYHNRFVSKLMSNEGNLSIDRIVGAWGAVCEAHPILRTIFTNGLSDQSTFQQIVLRSCTPSVAVKEALTNGINISQVAVSLEKLPLNPKKPPHHLVLYRESASVVYAIMDVSHTIIDARTFQALWKEIGFRYASASRGDSFTVAPGRAFSDYVVWLQTQEDETRRYWRNYLNGVKPSLFSRDPTAALDYEARGPMVSFSDASRLNRFCKEQGVTIAMFVQAAWAMVLQQHTGNSTVCFGSIRSDEEVIPGNGRTTQIMGPMISMLPCKFHLERPHTLTTLDVLEAARNDASSAMRYSGCSLAQLHDDLGLRDSSLFDTIMTIQRAWVMDLGGDGGPLTIDIVDAEDPTEYSIAVGVQYSESGLLIRLAHQRAHLSDSAIQHIARTFASVMDFMVESPAQPLTRVLRPLSPALDLTVLKQWNSEPSVTALNATGPSAFRAVAQSQGSAPAICSWDCNLTYSELDHLSDLLAYRLRVKHGVRADMIVPFCCVKASSAIVIMLAIWKAGAAFLPLDIKHPAERLATILRETDATLVLVNASERVEKMTSCFPGGSVDLVDLVTLRQTDTSDDDVHNELNSYQVEPHHAGYVVYTSGSTGRPKGIILDHRSIATSAVHTVRYFELTSTSRILQLSNLVFDFGLLDVIYAFFSGACLCMPTEAETTDDIGGAARRMGANYVECTPTYATMFSPQEAPSVRTLVLGGEPIKQENLDSWASHARIINGYGPAETGMSSVRDVMATNGGTLSQDIGRPGGCRYWVVNPENHDELVPVGTTGELVIEGPIVGRGYVNKAEATAAAFLDALEWTRYPEFESLGLGQHRFYKTGDLVRQKAADSFIYEGRKDNQVKIRGQRIETGEIEHHLHQQTKGDIKWAVEAIQGGASQETSLAAFCQVSSADVSQSQDSNILPPQAAKIAEPAREALRRAVPSYMVPEFYIPLRKFPTAGAMKTDRRALRTIGSSLSQAELTSYRMAVRYRDDGEENSGSTVKLAGLESLLQQTWAELLSVPVQSICASDDFFALGGNSIRSMRLVAMMRMSGYLLGVADIFRFPTLAGMAHKTRLFPHEDNSTTPKSAAVLNPSHIPHLRVLAQTRPWLDMSNIESIAPATDLQALMLSEGHIPDGGNMVATISVVPSAGRQQQSLNLARLREASEQVFRRHSILRTVFIQNEQSLMQVALRNLPFPQIHELRAGETSKHRVSVSSNMLDILPHFILTSDDTGSVCLGFNLTIHHAHYDAISLGHLMDDLKNAYIGTEILPRQPSFHEWSYHVASAEGFTESQDFWRELLRGSKSLPLAPSGSTKQRRRLSHAKQYRTFIKVHLSSLASPIGTTATVLKAAWSCVLSRVLEERDIVFSILSANRFAGTFAHGSAEQVPGPCINLVPIRAITGGGKKTLAMLVGELQEQSNDSLPHQHLGFRSIVKQCTQWPTSRFNSAILFQNHEAFGHDIKFGDTECTVSGVGQGTDSADVWITATPQADQMLSIELRFSPVNVPVELCQWISASLENLLNALSHSWDKKICDIQEELLRMTGPNPLSSIRNKMDTLRPPQFKLQDVVDQVIQANHFKYC